MPNPVRRTLQRMRAEKRGDEAFARRFGDPIKHTKVTLPQFAWPGGYTIMYATRDGSILCADCATDAFNTDIGVPDRQRHDLPIAMDTYDEGMPIECDECGYMLISSYGDPELTDEENDAMQAQAEEQNRKLKGHL